MASMSILDNLGAVSQLGIAGMRNTTTQAGQQIQQRLPELRAQTDANNRRLQEGSVINGTTLPSF
jgi:hypothetical protein